MKVEISFIALVLPLRFRVTVESFYKTEKQTYEVNILCVFEEILPDMFRLNTYSSYRKCTEACRSLSNVHRVCPIWDQGTSRGRERKREVEKKILFTLALFFYYFSLQSIASLLI